MKAPFVRRALIENDPGTRHDWHEMLVSSQEGVREIRVTSFGEGGRSQVHLSAWGARRLIAALQDALRDLED